MDPQEANGEESDEEFEAGEELIEVIEFDDNDDNDGDGSMNGENHDRDEMMQDSDEMQLEEEENEVVPDDAELVFSEHEGSVFCVCSDPNSKLAISGGEDDMAYVWNIETGETSFKCTGHKDSVVAAAFSRTGRYVASADMSGLVQAWGTQTGDLVWSAECSDLEWVQWHKLTDALLAGTTDGAVWMWLVPAGVCKIYQGPNTACTAAKITNDGHQLVAGYGDGSLRVWDLKAVITVYTTTGPELHSGAITSIDIHPDNNVILTASTDATAKLYSINSKKLVTTLDCSQPKPATTQPTEPTNTSADVESWLENQAMGDAEEGAMGDMEEKDGLECAQFSSTMNCLATASLCGKLTIWDIGSFVARCVCRHESGIVKCIWDADQPVIYTCTLDGLVHQWDARTGSKIKQWSGHTADILHLDLTRDGKRLITSSDDGTARVFRVTSDR